MHDSVRRFFKEHVGRDAAVLDFGGGVINGTLRDLASGSYTSVDIVEGEGVDVVADCASYVHPVPVDEVWCAGTLEHVEKWRDFITAAANNLQPGGRLILSCAGRGFKEHGARGGPMDPGEFYENIELSDLVDAIEAAGFAEHVVVSEGVDLFAVATR